MIISNQILHNALKISSIYFGLILGIPLVFFSIVLFNFYFFPQREVELFPLDDPNATYTIVYKDRLFALEYEGKKSTLANYAYIIDSPVELQQYLNKEVVIQGEFISKSRQCIMQNCKKFTVSWVGVSINSIKEVTPTL